MKFFSVAVFVVAASLHSTAVAFAFGASSSPSKEDASSNNEVVPSLEDERHSYYYKALFDNWLKQYKKLDNHRDLHSSDNGRSTGEYYFNDEYDYDTRFVIFRDNIEHIQDHNDAYEQGWTLYKKSTNGPFMDLTDEEFTQLYLMEPQDCSATTTTTTTTTVTEDIEDVPAGHTSSGRLRPEETAASSPSLSEPKKHPHVDWRTKGILTPVKNQGHCGSCWTFSTTGCLESHICLAAGKDCSEWTGLSEEQLVECAGDFNNFGCNGGLPSQAYEYLKYRGGLHTEDDYPYTAPSNGGKSQCSVELKSDDGKKEWTAKVSEVFNITSRDEDDLQHAVAQIGPVSIAYQVSPDFRFYEHGIYDSYNVTTNSTMCHDGTHDVNHAVVAVGLGTSVQTKDNVTTDIDYYIVRNSWSADWGMEGHFWIKRGHNLCGLADCASFPIVPVSDLRNDDGLIDRYSATKSLRG